MSPPLAGQQTQRLDLVVPNRAGLHARVSLKIMQTVAAFDSKVRIFKGKASAKGESVLELLSLGAAEGETVMVEASGKDAANVLDALKKLFENRFYIDEE